MAHPVAQPVAQSMADQGSTVCGTLGERRTGSQLITDATKLKVEGLRFGWQDTCAMADSHSLQQTWKPLTYPKPRLQPSTPLSLLPTPIQLCLGASGESPRASHWLESSVHGFLLDAQDTQGGGESAPVAQSVSKYMKCFVPQRAMLVWGERTLAVPLSTIEKWPTS